MPISQYIANLANLVKSGYKSNAFAPYVWFAAVVATVEIILITIIHDLFIQRMLSITFVATVTWGMVMYYKLFRKDPRLLQSESFRLEDKKLDMIAQKGSDIQINPVDLSTPPNLLSEGGSNE